MPQDNNTPMDGSRDQVMEKKSSIWQQIFANMLNQYNIYGPKLSIMNNIARFYSPEDGGWFSIYPDMEISGQIGVASSEPCFSDVPKSAAQRMISHMMSGFFPEQDRWHQLGLLNEKTGVFLSSDDILKLDINLYEGLRVINEKLATYRNMPEANFNGAAKNFLNSAALFGTGVFGVWENKGDKACPLKYEVIKTRDMMLQGDAGHKVVVTSRLKVFTEAQLRAEYGDAAVAQMINEKNAELAAAAAERHVTPDVVKNWIVAHIVSKKGWFGGDENVALAANHEWNSVDFLLNANKIIRKGGYENNPYMTARWALRGQDAFGIGLGESTIVTTQSLNNSERLLAILQQTMATPPLAVSDLAIGNAINFLPYSISPGLLNEDGKPLFAPILNPAELAQAMIVLEQRSEKWSRQIRDTFGNLEVEVYDNKPGNPKTAFEVQQQTLRKLAMFSANYGQLKNDFLDNLISREFSILVNAGVIERGLLDLFAKAGMQLKAKFVSPLGQAGHLQNLERVDGWVDSITKAAQLSPDAAAEMKSVNFHKIFAYQLKALNLPSDFLKTDGEIAAIKQKDDAAAAAATNSSNTASILQLAQAQKARADAQSVQPTAAPGI